MHLREAPSKHTPPPTHTSQSVCMSMQQRPERGCRETGVKMQIVLFPFLA